MRHSAFALAALMLGGAMGCDQLLDVRFPTRVPASVLDDPALARVVVQGAIADFECALANYVGAIAMITDELYASDNLGNLNSWDRRGQYESGGSIGCGRSPSFDVGIYVPLSTARFQADDAFGRIEDFDDAQVPGRTNLLATAAAYAGYSYTLFGEGFCEAVFDQGPALTWREVLDTAEQRFTTAIELAQSAGVDSILNMARVGRARVRLDLNKPAEAAADAREVPQGFVKLATYSRANERRENRVYDLYQIASVDPRFRNLTVGGVPDSRVRVIDAGRLGRDGITPQWFQTKYTSESSPIVMASWDEAQLIIAEAEGGQSAVDAINRLRTQAELPLFSSSDAGEILRQVARERRVELFLEGHRLNDRLRLQATFSVPATVNCPDCYTNLAQDSLILGLSFETGNTHKGLPFRDMTCLQLPSVERDNNPNLRGRTPRTTR